MKKKIVRMAVVGAGLWGESHANIYREHDWAEPVAICDLNLERAQAFAGKFGISQVYSDYREMLAQSDCDAVAIVTPDFLHADIAVACAEAGKHMIIEKPLATTREDVFRMVEAIECNGSAGHGRSAQPVEPAVQFRQAAGGIRKIRDSPKRSVPSER